MAMAVASSSATSTLHSVSECRMATITEKQPHRNPFENKLSDHLGIFHLYNACYWCIEHLFLTQPTFRLFFLMADCWCLYETRKIRGKCKPIIYVRTKTQNSIKNHYYELASASAAPHPLEYCIIMFLR